MWIPTSEQDILSAIEAEDLIETSTFDAKASLPAQGKSKDLAIDGAAMATDGGSLLYGIGEDENDRLTVPQPFELPGTRERVDQIVQTSISEPPTIEVYTIPTDDDPSLGYLVIAVPASPRAPHMVTVGKDNRYYGRNATGNKVLTEGEVARLYERRQRWEVDRDAMLEEAIALAPIPPREGFAYLHLVARPVVPDEGLFDRALGDRHAANFLGDLTSAALSAEVFPTSYGPDLTGGYYHERRADGWAVSQGLGEVWEERNDPSHVLDLEVRLDGGGRLFCGRAAEVYKDRLLIFERLIAGLSARFMSVLGGLYAAGSYLGPVDVSLAVTGLQGGISYALSQRFGVHPSPYDRNQYRTTERLLATTLMNDPRSAARGLV